MYLCTCISFESFKQHAKDWLSCLGHSKCIPKSKIRLSQIALFFIFLFSKPQVIILDPPLFLLFPYRNLQENSTLEM